MVRFAECQICNKTIEVEGNEPLRCPKHTELQMQNKARREEDLNIVDYLMNKYVFNPQLGF